MMARRSKSVRRPAGPGRFGGSGAAAILPPALAIALAITAAPTFGEAARAITVVGFWPANDRLTTPASNVTFAVEGIEAQSGDTVALTITLPTAAELARANAAEGTFLLVRRIPAGISLSAGMPTGKVWVVPTNQASTLRLLSTAETAGTFELEVNLIAPGNRVLAQRFVSVSLYPPRLSGEAVGALPANAPPEPRAALPSVPQREVQLLAPEEERVLLQRGEELMRQGGVAAARLIFEELAVQGSGKGALALARTYDPAIVRDTPTSAISHDVEEAIKWYERAAELGIAEAQVRRAEIASGK
jgi:hypothetical protein